MSAVCWSILEIHEPTFCLKNLRSFCVLMFLRRYTILWIVWSFCTSEGDFTVPVSVISNYWVCLWTVKLLLIICLFISSIIIIIRYNYNYAKTSILYGNVQLFCHFKSPRPFFREINLVPILNHLIWTLTSSLRKNYSYPLRLLLFFTCWGCPHMPLAKPQFEISMSFWQ